MTKTGYWSATGALKERVGEPVQRGDLFFIRQAQRLFAVNDKERIARDRIERFNAAADQDRNFSELRKINIVTRASLAGEQLAAIQSKAKPKTIAGKKRFMRAQFFSAAKIRRDDSRTARAIRRRQ